MKKTRECIKCTRFFYCKGKEKDEPCVNFEERKTTDGGRKMDKNHNRHI